MGLVKHEGCIVKGIEIKPAYAKLMRFYVPGPDGQGPTDTAVAIFGVSTTRGNLENGLALEEYTLNCSIDNHADQVFKELYDNAKTTLFIGWEDDIKEVIPSAGPEEDLEDNVDDIIIEEENEENNEGEEE